MGAIGPAWQVTNHSRLPLGSRPRPLVLPDYNAIYSQTDDAELPGLWYGDIGKGLGAAAPISSLPGLSALRGQVYGRCCYQTAAGCCDRACARLAIPDCSPHDGRRQLVNSRMCELWGSGGIHIFCKSSRYDSSLRETVG
jgi:hypothetical protein